MLRIFRHYIPITLLLLGLAETLILLVSIYLGAMFGMAFEHLSVNASALTAGLPLWAKAAAFCAAMLSGMIAMGLYQRDQRDAPVATLIRLSLSFLVGLIVMGLIYSMVPTIVIGNAAYVVALLSSFVGIATCRLVCSATTDARFARRVLVLGVGERARQIENLRRSSDRAGISIIGFVDIGIDPLVVNEAKIIRPNGTLRELADRFAADEIVVALDDRRKGIPIHEILDCKMHGFQIVEEATFLERQLGKIRLDALRPSAMIFADGFGVVLRQTEKRIIDVVLASFLMLLVLPLIAVTALAIAFESSGSVLYRQRRVGLRGEAFEVLKFRSMKQDAEVDGQPVWARRDDDRITKVGQIIRKFRIDELPQLLNVLKGEMSFVGPRPERPEFVAELSQAIPYYDLRHHVKPGITGWAQVSYPYGSSINDSREKLQYDLYYLKNYSLFLDLNILLQTVQVILWGKGAR